MSDAFGRLRVSNPFTTFEYRPNELTTGTSLDQDIWITTNNGTATSTYNSNNYINMTCSADGDYVIRQTKLPMLYQPGKSRLMMFTGVMFSRSVSSDTVVGRMGLFSTSGSTPTEGHYFKSDGNTLYWCETLGSTETSIAQDNWNIDTFDGNGSSGKTLTTSNLTKNLLLIIDQEWLGVGRVRCGFSIDGIIYYAHQFTHNDMSVPYTTTPLLPITYQIIGTTIGSAISMRHMCSTSISEGGYFPLGRRIGISLAASGITMVTSDTKYILLAVRPNSSYSTVMIKPIHIEAAYIGSSGQNTYNIELQVHSTVGSVGSISGSLTYSNFADSGSQYALGSGSETISSDGYIINECISGASSSVDFELSEFAALYTRRTISKYDTLYLVGSGSTNTIKITASMDFVELV